ncbi:hypothetical protein GDO78_012154 [Eleutherodactylus coqui]|uniref:Uncharacterized protein n=1 Tax=Eleutherodactylus coqui TaxID=57060 RepID=A0A8J6F300_ELECQ|nr:hypothetical protein GDO78_012154 [Eleutherodactylus coqui]
MTNLEANYSCGSHVPELCSECPGKEYCKNWDHSTTLGYVLYDGYLHAGAGGHVSFRPIPRRPPGADMRDKFFWCWTAGVFLSFCQCSAVNDILALNILEG